jgi:thioester reductase-like protein
MPTHVLLTGATGFLGAALVERLLAADPTLELLALVRARDDEDLRRRHARIVEALDPASRPRLTAVRGDVSAPRLGLDQRAYDALAERVDRVVHVAAAVRFDRPFDEARRVNVGGTEEALALCRRIRARGGTGRLDYVGTAYVAGDRTDLVGEEELEAGQGFRNTYERSKFEAEQRCRAARAELPVVIARPSIIVGDSRSGHTSSFKTIYWPMKLLVRFYGRWRAVLPRVVRLPVRPDCLLDLVPVDWVADAVAHLFASEAAAGGCYHLAAGPGAASIERLVNLACDHFEVARLGYLDPAGPVRYLGRGARLILRPTAPGLARNGELIMAYTRRNPRFDITHARAAGLSPPPIEDYYARLLSFAYGTDFGAAASP